MVAIPFVGPTYTSRSTTLDAQRCINLYLEEDQGQGGKSSPAALYGTPGLTERYALTFPQGSVAKPIRALFTSTRDGRLFVIAGSGVFGILANGTVIEPASTKLLQTSSGPVSITDNALEMYITDGTAGYIFNYSADTLTTITDPDYLGPGPATTQDSYFVTIRPDSDQFFISGLNDGLNYAAADVTSADGKPDKAVGIASDQRLLWIFKQQSIQVFYNSGNADFPFEEIQGGFLDVGAVNPWSIQALQNTMVWLGETARGEGIVYASQGFIPTRISTHAIELIIRTWADLTQCRSYTYEDEGHTFYVLWNPDGTVVFDFVTGMWHERAALRSDGTLGTHRVCCFTRAHDTLFGGDYETNQVYAMSLDTYTDNGTPIPRIRAAQYVDGQRRRLRHSRFELDFERGVGLSGSPVVGTDPQVELRWSNDHAQTWADYSAASLGKIGEYTTRAKWWRLGVARERIYEARITAPVKVAIIGAHLNG